ncbi:MAG: Holliday junction branch migration protein RuvA [Candidatus Andersenbacteria bacterium]
MIAYLRGVVVQREEKAVIVDVNGVGYRVFAGSVLREKLTRGQEVQLRIYQNFSDSGQDLFGFDNQEELSYFKLLMKVPSIGAKTARGILDIAPPQVLEQAVAEEDVTLLTKVSGIGKKTAERIVVELKEKLGPSKKKHGASGALQQQTIEALVSIGYTPVQARNAAANLPKSVKTVEEAVRAALQQQSVA